MQFAQLQCNENCLFHSEKSPCHAKATGVTCTAKATADKMLQMSPTPGGLPPFSKKYTPTRAVKALAQVIGVKRSPVNAAKKGTIKTLTGNGHVSLAQQL